MNTIDTVKTMRTVDNVPAPNVMVNANDMRRGSPTAPPVGFFWLFGNGQNVLFGNGQSVSV